MKKSLLLSLVISSAVILNGCYSNYEIEQANRIITALPEEVKGCTFVGNVDTGPLGTIQTARFQLQYDAAKLGATHLVETHAYAGAITYRLVGVALSGRAYKCPLGVGPKVASQEGQLKFNIPPEQTIFPDDPFDPLD